MWAGQHGEEAPQLQRCHFCKHLFLQANINYILIVMVNGHSHIIHNLYVFYTIIHAQFSISFIALSQDS